MPGRLGRHLKNRLRFHRESAGNIRKKASQDVPLIVKLGVQDEIPGGLEFEEGKQAARRRAEWGYAAIEISQGLRGRGYEQTEFRTHVKRVDQEANFEAWTREVKHSGYVLTMVVGGLRSFGRLEEIVEKGEADFVSMSRPLIREPSLVYAWQAGDRHRATCLCRNQCLEALSAGEFLCIVSRKGKNERLTWKELQDD